MTFTNNSIDWSPATRYAYRNCTHELIEDADGKYQFMPIYRMKSHFMARYFIIFFSFVIVMFFLSIIALNNFINGKFNIYEFTSIVCFIIWFVGSLLYGEIKTRKIIYKPNFFDIKNNLYFTFDHFYLKQKKEIQESISSIKAIQILDKIIRPPKWKEYTAYELNLIFDSGRRRNVICHGCYENIKKDAEKLSKYLDIPILERETP